VVSALAVCSDLSYVLYLDDRWSPWPLGERWLARALEILEEDSHVEQVCLTHQGDVTDEAARRVFPRWFFAGTPSLLRADRLNQVLRLETAKHAPRRWTRSWAEPPSLQTRQLSPGGFRLDAGHGRPTRPR